MCSTQTIAQCLPTPLCPAHSACPRPLMRKPAVRSRRRRWATAIQAVATGPPSLCSAVQFDHLAVEPRTERLHKCRAPWRIIISRVGLCRIQRSEKETGAFGIAVNSALVMVLSCFRRLLQSRVAVGMLKETQRNLRGPCQSLKRLSPPWYFISSVSHQYYLSAAEVEE
jgi:hypothetical protein